MARPDLREEKARRRRASKQRRTIEGRKTGACLCPCHGGVFGPEAGGTHPGQPCLCKRTRGVL